MSQAPAPGPRLIRFGVFELDPGSGELRKSGVRLSLQQQPLQVLTLLLEQPGKLVTRDALRQRLWPGDTYGDFEHGLNAVVNRLRDTLGDSADLPTFIETLPRRGYRFIAPVDLPDATASPAHGDVAPQAGPTTSPRRQRGLKVTSAIALGLAVLVSGAAWLLWPSPDVSKPLRVVPLTTLSGEEDWPAFSPDGEQVAFVWSGEKRTNSDIYVTIVGSFDHRRLTTDPAVDYAPSWSPDGRQIAFLRTTGVEPKLEQARWGNGAKSSGRIHIISPLGGSDLKVSDFPVSTKIGWSPDGRFIVAGRDSRSAGSSDPGIYLIPASGGEPRAITRTKPPAWHFSPAFSPDGRHVAYASCTVSGPHRPSECDVNLVDVDAAFSPTSEPRRLTDHPMSLLDGLTWSRDGRFIIFFGEESGPVYHHLWRVPADRSHAPERIEVAGMSASRPATVSSRDRLAFGQWQEDLDVYRFDPGRPPQAIAVSSFVDGDPQISPDGRRIALASTRSGKVEIWVSAADGTDAHQLTHGPGQWQGSPHWSPDGRWIAFDSQGDDGHWHIWTIDAEGGTARQVTKESGDQNVPTWSHDGQWIYFSAESEGVRNIWRVRSAGGAAERITKTGSGFFALEAPDGKSIVYQADAYEDAALLAAPIAGGPGRQLVSCAKTSAFDVSQHDIYYVACDSANDPSVHAVNPATGKDRSLGTLYGFDFPFPIGFAVSRDGTTVFM
jgi:Tol biopolymer transport system component/DNA-binding winged helix-turn-helix (wHTH) protein